MNTHVFTNEEKDIKNLNVEDVIRLEEKAKVIRKYIINMIYQAKSGHSGGVLSCTDILTVIYFFKMKHNPQDPKWENRDRFILSKGHATPALYAILAECGYFPTEELNTLRKFGSRLQGHPDINLPGIEVSSGSLGQGLSIASGIALSAKLDKNDFKIYVLLGDGECDEGQIWEAAMFASHYNLDNITAIIDRNGFQIDGKTEDIMSLESLEDKFKAFNWNVYKCNGNDIRDLISVFNNVQNRSNRKPTVIIANTIKGKGISFMENDNSFHGRVPSKTEYEIAIKELE